MRKIFTGLLVATLAAPAIAFPVAAFANHEEKFEQIDSNRDGVISKAEADAHHTEKFAAKDANGDGQISQAEFDAFVKAKKDDRRAAR